MLILLLTRAAAAQAPDRFRLIAPTADRAYVGQAIAIRLEIPASAIATSLRLPPVDGGRIELSPPVDEIPKGTPLVRTGVLLPERPGTIVVPAVRAEAGDQTWVSNPVRLEIRPIPASGRPATFRGGVGPLRLETQWSRPSVRQGDVAELEITARGEGVVGQDRPFSLAVASGSPPAQIGRSEIQTSLIPPVRVERFRVRALEPGQVRFDPLLCSTFDPATGRFSTSRGTIAPLEVQALPGPEGTPVNGVGSGADVRPGWAQAGWTALWLFGPLAALALVVFVHRCARRLAGPRGARLVRALAKARSWHAGEPSPTFARRIVELLAEILREPQQVGGAVLTPDDARRGWLEWLGDDGLARAAEGLVARCEPALYRQPGSMADDPKAWNEARRTELVSLLDASRQGRLRPRREASP